MPHNEELIILLFSINNWDRFYDAYSNTHFVQSTVQNCTYACMYLIFTSNTCRKFIYIYHIVDFYYRWLTDKRALIRHSKKLTLQFGNIYVIIWQEFRQVTRYIQCVMLSRTIDHMLCYTESCQIYKSCTVKQLFFCNENGMFKENRSFAGHISLK